ncbi:MFS transporter [Salinibacterium sp. NSLL150]|uniref:MFS transporter n=1 Tax=unclassified Salinibacterium TaxID=2632331 RepID=UPI0018CE11F7|nr:MULTISPECIES: MFS transporter [unclassified Salinibacterium]MBH0100136.1 MFS transporter [Salinibacterium sp. NSLL35]MBH0102890.1 MFS transporter [Salinibacterium sp. NSLL150]MBH0105650.1 MFS transporter [Salinibacterium sp. NSLL16]MBH0108410.1 MFS transporter [Salinibacterium sp. NSLL17]
MTTPTRTLWRGRILALAGILFVALNVRTAVAAISPIIGVIENDIPISSLGLGMLGMLPPIAFAIAGVAAPALARARGLDAGLLIAAAAMVAGSSLRAVSDNYIVLAIGSFVALAGMGIGNVLLPPAVKKYFPDRLATVTGGYVVLISLGAAIPAFFAAPIADASGWRVSVAVWAALALTAFVPWLVLTLRGRHAKRRAVNDESVLPLTPHISVWAVAKSRTAWAITIAFGVSSIAFYSFFAWLPEILIESAQFTPVEAGAMLSLFGLIGIPLGILSPILASRVQNIGVVIAGGVFAGVIGFTGLAFAPTVATWLWVVLVGISSILFPLCLVLINLRTRSHEGSAALSGFVQSVAYSVAALGPFAVALVRELSGGWVWPLMFLLVTSLLALISAVMLARPSFVEDEIDFPAAALDD